MNSRAPLFKALLSHAYGLAGERTKALSILEEIKLLSKQQYVSPMDFAIVYIGLGDREVAFLNYPYPYVTSESCFHWQFSRERS